MIFKRDFFSQLYQRLKNSCLKPLLGIAQRLAAEVEVYLGCRISSYPSVLVYQMGKVGSTTVSKSLNAAGLKNFIYDIHFLSDDLYKYHKLYNDSGIVPVPYHIDLGMALRKRIIRGSFNKFKIISMVRDPIGRQVSNIFENPDLLDTDIRNSDGLVDAVKILKFIEKKFAEDSFFDYVFNWFDKELKKVFDIDVFSQPFNRDAGWETYDNGKTEVLVIRLEDLSRIGEAVIQRFLGLHDRVPLVKANVRSETREADAYQFIKNNLKIQRSLCEKIYDSRFVSHFYNDEQVAQMIKQWI